MYFRQSIENSSVGGIELALSISSAASILGTAAVIIGVMAIVVFGQVSQTRQRLATIQKE